MRGQRFGEVRGARANSADDLDGVGARLFLHHEEERVVFVGACDLTNLFEVVADAGDVADPNDGAGWGRKRVFECDGAADDDVFDLGEALEFTGDADWIIELAEVEAAGGERDVLGGEGAGEAEDRRVRSREVSGAGFDDELTGCDVEHLDAADAGDAPDLHADSALHVFAVVEDAAAL